MPSRSPSSRLSRAQRDRWRAAVLERDRTCRVCDERPASEAHHVVSVAEDPTMAYDVENGLGTCGRCHRLARMRGADLHELKAKLPQPVNARLAERMRRTLNG
jgi:5-methylcytosine-specific restriction endonuclease McrA